MLLQILGPLESFATEVAFVRLEGNVNADMGRDMIAFNRCCSARVPTTGEVKIICALATDMFLTDVLEKGLSRRAFFRTFLPLTAETIVDSRTRGLCLNLGLLLLLLLLSWRLLLLLRRLRLVLDRTLVLVDLFRHFGCLGGLARVLGLAL